MSLHVYQGRAFGEERIIGTSSLGNTPMRSWVPRASGSRGITSFKAAVVPAILELLPVTQNISSCIWA